MKPILLTPFGAQLIETTSCAFIVCVSHFARMKAPGSSNLTCLIFSPLEPHWGLSGYNIVEWENERKNGQSTLQFCILTHSYFMTKVWEWRIQILSWKKFALFLSFKGYPKTKNGDIFKPSLIYKISPTSYKSFARSEAFGTPNWHKFEAFGTNPLQRLRPLAYPNWPFKQLLHFQKNCLTHGGDLVFGEICGRPCDGVEVLQQYLQCWQFQDDSEKSLWGLRFHSCKKHKICLNFPL